MRLSHCPICTLLVLAVVNLCPGSGLAVAGETVAIFVRDGRVLSGEIDNRTTTSDLWLHSSEPSILILSSIPWSDITEARIGAEKLSPTELRGRVDRLKKPLPVEVLKRRKRPAGSPNSPAAPIVQQVEIVPDVANWKRGVAPDGLELRIRPLQANLQPAPVDGLVTVRLLGRRLGTTDRLQSPTGFGFWTDGSNVREYTSRLSNNRYVELGRWTERLSNATLTDSGYLLRLPYRNVHPEQDLDIALDAIVDVRLNVDGQGIHEATAPVQLRKYDPLREELQRERGRRYFPDEF